MSDKSKNGYTGKLFELLILMKVCLEYNITFRHKEECNKLIKLSEIKSEDAKHLAGKANRLYHNVIHKLIANNLNNSLLSYDWNGHQHSGYNDISLIGFNGTSIILQVKQCAGDNLGTPKNRGFQASLSAFCVKHGLLECLFEKYCLSYDSHKQQDRFKEDMYTFQTAFTKCCLSSFKYHMSSREKMLMAKTMVLDDATSDTYFCVVNDNREVLYDYKKMLTDLANNTLNVSLVNDSITSKGATFIIGDKMFRFQFRPSTNTAAPEYKKFSKDGKRSPCIRVFKKA